MKHFALIIGLMLIVFTLVWFQRDTDHDSLALTAESDRATVKILTVGDPYSVVLERHGPVLLGEMGLDVSIDRVGYDAIRRMIIAQEDLPIADYDLVAFDALWTAELAERGSLLPLPAEWDQLYPTARTDHYIPQSMEMIQWDGKVYGLPIQPHSELLWYRIDIFEADNIKPPASFDALLAAAKTLHQPDKGVYGIVWNGQRGSALGQTVSHLYAAYGGQILTDDGRPQLDSKAGHQVADLLQQLVQYSPPDVLTTAWDQRRNRFFSGQVAMAYGWGARFGESLLGSQGKELQAVTAVVAPPMGDPSIQAVPLGSWNFGIPANVGPAALDRARKTLAALCGVKGACDLASLGNAGPAVSSLLTDEDLGKPFGGLFPIMADLGERRAFSFEARPMSPIWNDVALILGEEFHDFLRGDLPKEVMLRQAQERALKLVGQH